jgi:hypothetical protein
MLTELHLHLYGCIGPLDLLRHLAGRDQVDWAPYEAGMLAAYGAVPPVRELVERYRAGSADAARAFADIFVYSDRDSGSFDRFQAKFRLLYAGSVRHQPDPDPARCAAEVAAFAAGVRASHERQQIAHAEHRVLLGTDLGSPTNQAVLGALLAAYDAAAGAPVQRLAVSLDRADPWPGWEQLRRLALGPHGRALTAVDFCSDEEGHPPKEKAALLAAIREFNAEHPSRALAVLYHVGESFRDKSLESAVRWVQEAAELGAHRLGHAIALGIDPAVFGPHVRTESVAERRDQIGYDLRHHAELRAAGVLVQPSALRAELSRLAGLPASARIAVPYDEARLDQVRARQRVAMSAIRATGAVLEVCPTSSRRIGGIADPAHHPVHRFLAAGLPVVVSSDDPGIFATTLADELDWVCEHTGRGAELRRLLLRTAWASRSEVLSGRPDGAAR